MNTRLLLVLGLVALLAAAAVFAAPSAEPDPKVTAPKSDAPAPVAVAPKADAGKEITFPPATKRLFQNEDFDR